MNQLRKARVLVVDDDARWNAELEAELTFQAVFETDLAAGMKQIDRRKRWNGAIFDRYLLEGDTPFPKGKLMSNAGFILAAAFLEKFPGAPVSVCSGSGSPRELPATVKKLLQTGQLLYLVKTRPSAAHVAVRHILGETVNQGAIEKILDTFMLEPNIFGLGLNLRTIIDRIRSR